MDKLFEYYHIMKTGGENKAFAQFKGTYISDFPIKLSKLDFKTIVLKRIEDQKNISNQINKFQRTIQRKFFFSSSSLTTEHAPLPLPLSLPLPKKLQDWYLLSYADFIKELTKQKVKLTLSQEAEWEDYFSTEAKKVITLKTEIDTIDKAIDRMVYELYGLSDEEIAIVENS